MDNRNIVIALVVIIMLLLVAVLFIYNRRKSAHLKQKFGPEYDRTLQEQGDSRHAEAVLTEREKRVEKFPLTPLSPTDRQSFAEDWSAVQRRFVDDPTLALRDANKLVTTVMAARGYPMADFDQRAADISVHYPALVQNYRTAREIALRDAEGQASTEEARQAMMHYRSLFDELLESPQPGT